MKSKTMLGMSESNFNSLLIATLLIGTSLAFYGCIGLFSWTVAEGIPVRRVFALLVMIGIMSSCIGVFVGFLFGIPRSLSESQNDDKSLDSKVATDGRSIPHNHARYSINTNLELVSDWLTKMLVGIGLTQFHNIRTYLIDISAYFSSGLDGIAGIQPMITTIILCYLFLGFFTGYLLTRLYISRALVVADSGIEKISSHEHAEKQEESKLSV